LMELGIATPAPGAEVSYILDGQQRLTTLAPFYSDGYNCLSG
jgi:hypothetical protein